ncbi:neutral zinc metallopeptidase [Arcanobacterium phocisimile]|uniref:Neutral zinc metallopeptidase n=1 Tax=Arcanobacterium phocisimile TaxID=1302235 RepID=A0ABX7IH22_9ACTO|nr:neutral zinc metallopeptidase [Arcanobacterium phocisimile]QRV01430.1 neutral zinc metallopeptidase [Arcanobacterium phocisimile]
MSFNDNIHLDTSGTQRRSGGKLAAGGISGIGLAGVLIYFLFTGQLPPIDALTGAQTQQAPSSTSQTSLAEECQAGQDANTKVECRMVAGQNSLNHMWNDQLPADTGIAHKTPGFVLFSGAVSTACGDASSQQGPFFCPGDDSIYIDVSFFDQLERFGARNAPLAQLYILAHEWGHHIQLQTGDLAKIHHQSSGPQSSLVRSELQADCLAGAWIHHASTTIDPQTGVPFMKTPTDEQLRDALLAAQSVGDDHLAEISGHNAHPDSFSHGSSAQRFNWLKRGIDKGSYTACNTWDVGQP